MATYYNFTIQDCYSDRTVTADSTSYIPAGNNTGGDQTVAWHSWTMSFEPETDEQREARLKQEQEQELVIKAAEELLKGYIGAEAFGKLYEVGYIELDSQKYKDCRYRVKRNHNAVVEVVNKDGKVVDKLCFQPAIDCPAPDQLLTKIVLLELAEEFVLAKANHHRQGL